MYKYESGPYYYCHIDKSERPLCGSVAMKEIWHHLYKPRKYKNKDWNTLTEQEKEDRCNLSIRHSIKFSDKWDKWSEPREVEAWGICEKYSRRD
jgi:hypothetical protein